MLKAVDLLITPAGASKQELAAHLGVDKRTVERLLGLLQELNFPIYDERDSLSGKKIWRMVDTYVMKLPNITLPNIRLTLPELISLYLIKGEAKLFHGTEIEKMADSAFGKLAFFFCCVGKGKLCNFNKIETRPGFSVSRTHLEKLLNMLRMIRIERQFGVKEFVPAWYEDITCYHRDAL